MGTYTLVFANFLLILQLVSAIPSGYPAGSGGWNDVENGRQGTANTKYYMQSKQPTADIGARPLSTNINLDDINESQFPPPPTQKDALAEISFEDNNDIKGSSKYSDRIDRNVLSGAGHLGTNEIIRIPNASPDKDSLSTSNKNNYDKKDETNDERAPAANKQYNYPELDKAVENAVNNLPSNDESPLAPLIKVFNERKREREDANMSPKDLAWEKFYQNTLILKLANKAQKQKEENYLQNENQGQDKSSPLENQNGVNEEQPCDCEGECDETPQDQSAPEMTGCDEETTLDQTKTEKQRFGEAMPKDQPVTEDSECGEETSQDQIETGKPLEQGSHLGNDDNQTNLRNPKILAHVIVMLSRPKMEEKETIRNPALTPYTPFGNEQLFRPRENLPLSNMFLRFVAKSNSMTIIPSTFPKRNEDYSQHEQEITSMPTGYGDNSDEDRRGQENLRSSFPRDESDESEIDSSDYRKRAYFTRYPSDDQGLSFQNKEVAQQTLPSELSLLKVLINIMKQKAANNALKEMQRKQTISLPIFEESSNTPSLPMSRLVITRPINILPPPQLPPLHFPDENSGYKIKHLEDDRGFPIYRELKGADRKTDGEPVIPVNTLDQSQEHANSDGFAQKNSTPEDIPWFIRNILANLSGPAEHGLQPTPVPPSPLQKPAEEKNPVLFRALLAPYSL